MESHTDTVKNKIKIKIKLKKTRKNNKNDLKISGESKTMRLNEKYIDLMDTLGYIMRTRKDVMRARAYANAKETISGFNGDITTPEQLKGMKGIGTTIYQKLVDYEATGTLRVLEESKDIVAKKKATDVFANIYGVGEKSAEELVDKGITTMEQLELRKDEVLNDKQKIGLKYYNDILQRIPRAEIVEYEKIFKSAFPKNIECSRFEIVGSYRRGLSSSGDIDVIITSSHSNVFKMFIDELLSRKIIVEVLSRGNSKCLVVAKLPGAQYARRVDFLYTTPEEYPFSVLYFTGSKEFNMAMREHALSMKYTLNEHGLSVMENKKKGDRVDHVFLDEKSIFDFLKMEYTEPTLRIRGLLPPVRPPSPVTGVVENKVVENKVVENTVVENTVVSTKSASKKKTTKHRVTKKKVDNKNAIVDKNDKNIDLFKKNGIQVLQTLTESQLLKMLEDANYAFHTLGSPIMTDAEYDILYEYIETKYKKPAEIGAPVEKNKVVLPYEMASMDKIKPDTGALVKWKSKYYGPYVLSCKLDGVSGMYSTEGDVPKLYTRGDGKVGQDISHLIPKLRLPKEKGLVIRGEFVIPKKVFATKYAQDFANPRNLVAGIVNRKTSDEKINDMRFVAYEVIKPDGLTPSSQMAKLASLDVDVVQNEIMGNITNEQLSQLLQDWRKYYLYEIDGVIVADDEVHPRTTGNPDHSFAFKMVLSDQIAEAHVIDVIWTASKDGYLKPRVQIMPLKLGGVTIQFATGFNGSFIEQNKIGIGAIIQIVRSGDVIPKIISVTTPAEQAKMPDVDYVWNETHVDIMLADATDDATVLSKNIAGFFKGIEVDGLGPKNVDKMISAGHDSVPKILQMTKDDFLKVEGFQEKTATKLLEGIQAKVEAASLPTLMAVSNKLGRGFSIKRAELILTEYPTVFVEGERSVAKLVAIKGIEKKSAQAFVDHIPEFLEFMKDCGLESKLEFQRTKPIESGHALYGKSIIFTGLRDKVLEDRLKALGAKIGSGVSKNTFAVLAVEPTGKTEEAKKIGIPIMTPAEFIDKYL